MNNTQNYGRITLRTIEGQKYAKVQDLMDWLDDSATIGDTLSGLTPQIKHYADAVRSVRDFLKDMRDQ